MKNLLDRAIELTTFLGLFSGGLTTFYLGESVGNKAIMYFALVAIFSFTSLLTLSIILLFRDIIKHPKEIMPTDFWY